MEDKLKGYKPAPPDRQNMKHLTLVRLRFSDECVTGKMISEDDYIDFCTLERPWLDNKKYVSCIPPGLYVFKFHSGPTKKRVWQADVPNRTGILIHSGNIVDETVGCILIGTGFQKWPGDKTALKQSREALNRLREYIGIDKTGKLNSFMLSIVSA